MSPVERSAEEFVKEKTTNAEQRSTESARIKEETLPSVKATEDVLDDVYENIPLDQMKFHAEKSLFTYQCPCGDLFEIYLDEMYEGENIAHCPSCSLIVKVIFDTSQLPPLPPQEE
eukprot:CAMPEP_0197315126 /NCGR_PEP_ID=MMETSP0891-20130614/36882_1 /TAXON_ID=44058 ORGANISM="Aureoumbra lagunensis, Strain CCMP1510" /NCGR_SAMPLE_ID=MMETSP0891 /ASSEMBLY_ACC=CAM_ASM_000534 /LENGTH=115 /DNA_ID=CAMNT_0042803923 /DNA_START=121 /DNA_END=465 /DNA_ORIENTATION=+